MENSSHPSRISEHSYANILLGAVFGAVATIAIGKLTKESLDYPFALCGLLGVSIALIVGNRRWGRSLPASYQSDASYAYSASKRSKEHELGQTRTLPAQKTIEPPVEVTEKNAESARLRSIFAGLTEGIVLQNLDGQIVECNAAAERILGLTEDQIQGRSSMHPDWEAIREDGSPLPGPEHPAMITLRTGIPIRNSVFGVRTPAGERKWISVNTEPVFDDKGTLVSVVASFTDISSSREQSQRLQLIIDGSQIGTWDWDIPTGSVVYSQRWATMLGYELSEIEPDVGAWERMLDPASLLQSWTAVQEHIEGKTKEYRNELRLRRKDGSYAWVLATGTITARLADGKPLRMVGIHIDISEQKAAEQALMEAKTAANAASAAKSDFLANMSHEIRTPMTAILGFNDLLAAELRGLDCSPNTFEFLETIRRNGEHLLEIINDILDISKIEAGKLFVESVDVSLTDLVDDVVSMMRVRAVAKGLELRVVYSEKLPSIIQSDPVRLRQILVNLLGNAIKFTDRGSVILAADCDWTTLELLITVSDTGIGLSNEQIDKLFQAFTQADTSTTRKYGGTGLGLQISKRLANLLGGDISVTSQQGIGSQFTLRVSMGPEAVPNTRRATSIGSDVATATPSTSNNVAPLQGMRILVAEDGGDNQRLIGYILRKAGADVRIVENGKLAIEMLTIDGSIEGNLRMPPPFDLFLTDMQMPELDGYSTARLLRSKGSKIPIIALTANAMSSDMEKCMVAGCNAYASKPIEKNALLDVCIQHGFRASERRPENTSTH